MCLQSVIEEWDLSEGFLLYVIYQTIETFVL